VSLYIRPGNRVDVSWSPDDPTTGKEAIDAVVGSVDSYPVEVDRETAAQIRDEYQRLVAESGGSS
jgi:hypothetical protein